MVVIFSCISITVDLWRVATPLYIDQKWGVFHNILYASRFSGLRVILGNIYLSKFVIINYTNQLFRPCEIGPLIFFDLLHHGIVLVHPLGCVGHPNLVTLEYLCRTTLATTCPATVSLPIPQFMGCHLRTQVSLGHQVIWMWVPCS